MSGAIPNDLADVLRELGKCIVGLGPYQDDAVLCGGIVPVLYRRVFPELATRLRPLTTFDLDWLVPKPLRLRGTTLHDRLLQSGFEARRSGSHDLPVTQYIPAAGQPAVASPIYVEFLTPRSGAQNDRRGVNQGIVEVQPGLHAQTDPYLGVLLAQLLTVEASTIAELQLSGEHRLRLPHPTCFLLQKLLIHERREVGKQDNDACHIYDVALLTRSMWPQIRELLSKLKRDRKVPANWFKTARNILETLFCAPTSRGCVAVARNYSGLVSEEEVRAGMSAFLAECWDGSGT